jgi:hypothetical protein
MKLINTNRLTREQCIKIIEESDFENKDKATFIVGSIYDFNDYVCSISISKTKYTCEWMRRGKAFVTSLTKKHHFWSKHEGPKVWVYQTPYFPFR